MLTIQDTDACLIGSIRSRPAHPLDSFRRFVEPKPEQSSQQWLLIEVTSVKNGSSRSIPTLGPSTMQLIADTDEPMKVIKFNCQC